MKHERPADKATDAPAPKKARKSVYRLGPVLFLATQADIDRVRDDYDKEVVDEYEFCINDGCTLYWAPDDIDLVSENEEHVRLFAKVFSDNDTDPITDALEDIAERGDDEDEYEDEDEDEEEDD